MRNFPSGNSKTQPYGGKDETNKIYSRIRE